MKYTYKITGMTCNGCKAVVAEKLASIRDVQHITVDLEKAEATVHMTHLLSVAILQDALPPKYTITEQKEENNLEQLQPPSRENASRHYPLFPLVLIFAYLTIASTLMNFNPWDTDNFMLDFMGLFYIVFSFFKMLDLRGFPDSFSMYDPLAKRLPIYGWIYPFIETALGLMFLMRFEIEIALIATLIILGGTTIGVAKALFAKKSIRCACLGTVLKLPMTKATLIENTVMLAMAVWMLIRIYP
ncbi:MAG: MauE/DoxX family redox-associated membrane protein [Bacteroidota bacterium]